MKDEALAHWRPIKSERFQPEEWPDALVTMILLCKVFFGSGSFDQARFHANQLLFLNHVKPVGTLQFAGYNQSFLTLETQSPKLFEKQQPDSSFCVKRKPLVGFYFSEEVLLGGDCLSLCSPSLEGDLLEPI